MTRRRRTLPICRACKNGLGFDRPNNAPLADCCKAAPSVMEFDASGKLLRAWGGPADPGFLESKCKAADGCIWPNSEHGIYVDHSDNVWIAGNGRAPVSPHSKLDHAQSRVPTALS